ncbi:MAG: M23 family metallopeptidase [Bacteroidetes bacterium]|nr:M23 family metallopeptidase [Bacteroidota bacterium]
MGSVKTKKRLPDSYQVLVYHSHDITREPVRFRLSKNWLITGIVVVLLLFAGAGASLILFTPLVGLAPGAVDSGTYQRDVIDNARRMDSLSKAIAVRSDYFARFQNLMKTDSLDTTTRAVPKQDGLVAEGAPVVEQADEALSPIGFGLEEASSYAEEDLSALTDSYASQAIPLSLGGLILSAPVKGIITRGVQPGVSHFGLDIAVKSGTPVSAMASGKVVFVDWTLKTGYTVVVQHVSGFVSVYKHLSSVMVQHGSAITTGEFIALSGNTGEYTTGPHLHVELWHNGNYLNPLDYLSRF